MCFDHHLTARSYPTPFPHKARLAEKVTVNGNPLVAAHVARGINPPQMQMGWKDFELRTHIEHVVILPDFYTISGRDIFFHRDLTLKSVSHLLDQGAFGCRIDRQIHLLAKIGCKWIPETAADRPELKLCRQREGNCTTFDGLV
jgi:hypothetical protein